MNNTVILVDMTQPNHQVTTAFNMYDFFIYVINDDTEEEEDCPICFGQPETTTIQTFCGHSFCERCIKGWVILKLLAAENPNCPICRADF